MNISKVLFAGCVTGLSLTIASAQPLGSSQQDKALELLRQRMAAERTESSVPSGAGASARSVEEPSGAVSVSAPVKQPEDPAAYQDALNALRDSIAKERQAPQAAPVAVPASPAVVPSASPDPNVLNSLRDVIAAQRQAVKPAPTPPRMEVPRSQVVPVKAPAAPTVVPSASPDPNTLNSLREAIATQRQVAPPVRAEVPSSVPAEKTVEPALAAPSTQTIKPVSEPVSAPPAPTVVPQPSGPKSKQQQLMDLLELYKANKVTPHEYHEQRAKIISES